MDLLTDFNTWRIVLEVAALCGLGVSVKKYKIFYDIVLSLSKAIKDDKKHAGELDVAKRVKMLTFENGTKKVLDKLLEKHDLFV